MMNFTYATAKYLEKQVKLMWTPKAFYFKHNVDKSLDQGKPKTKYPSNNNVIEEEITIAI